MEGSFKRRMRNAMKHLQEEEELSRITKTTTPVAERKPVELYTSRHYQFSKHLEDTPTPVLREEEADCDLHFTKLRDQEEQLAIIQRRLWEQSRLIESLQATIKRLQEELKKAKDLDFIKTTIISDLLSDREKLDQENKELVRIYGEKQRLCEHFEEELSRQQRVICNMLLDMKRLQRENKELVEVGLQLRGEKQQLSEYFDEQLSRERKLRKDCCRSLMDREHVISLLSREQKRCFVSIWQTSAEDAKPEDKKESLEKMKPQVLENTLKKDWLETSVDNLKSKKSKESRQKVLGWLQESLKNMKEVSDKASRPSLAEWLKGSLNNLQKESPETFREDVNNWLDMSLNQLQEEGPGTSSLNVQEWLEASIQGIQDLQKSEVEPRRGLRKEWLEQSVENLKKRSSGGPVENILPWLQGSLERLSSSTEPKPVLEKWVQDALKNLEEGRSGVDNQDVKDWLQTTVNNLEEEGPEAPHLDIQEWLESSIKCVKHLQKPRVTFRGSLRKDWLEQSIGNLKKLSSEGPMGNILPWLQRSLESLSSSTEPKPVLEKWLQDALKRLEEGPSEVDNQGVKEWLQTALNNLEEEGSEAPHLDIQEWLKASIKGIQDLNGQYSKGRSVEESREREGLVEPGRSEKSSTNGWLQDSLASSREPASASSRIGLQGWLQATLKRLRRESPDGTRSNLEEWLQEAIENAQERCPEESRQYVKEWLGVALRHLQEGGPEAPHLSVEEWLERSIQGLQKEIFEEMIGSTDPEAQKRKIALSKGTPSQGKQIIRKSLGKESSRFRKRQRQILKIIGIVILLAMFLFSLSVHFRQYCVVSEKVLRPY